jgi:ribosome biogenesis protein BRX1
MAKKNNKKSQNENKNEQNGSATTTVSTNNNNGVKNKKEKATRSLSKNKWTNKQRVLLISSRGVSYLARHVLDNLKCLMPHTKTDSKFDNKHNLKELNEIAEIRNCNKVLYVEMYKKQDAYLWLSAQPHGPSVKFALENLHTMEELKLTGNCLKGSRPIISFNDEFDSEPHWKLLKEVFTQVFGTPNHHPKSQPFVDHVLNFSILDNKIWVRNYQIGDEAGSLAEVGPRFVLNPMKIFDGCFGGAILYENLHYIPPVVNRRLVKEKAAQRYNSRISQKLSIESRKPTGDTFMIDPTNDVFRV